MWSLFSLFCCIQLVHGSFYRLSFRRRTSSVCRDISTACPRYVSRCKDSVNVRYQCKKTCKLCGTTTTTTTTRTTSTACFNKGSYCDVDAGLRNLLCRTPFGQENCSVLCNTCGKVFTKAPTLTMFTTKPRTTYYPTWSTTKQTTKPTTTKTTSSATTTTTTTTASTTTTTTTASATTTTTTASATSTVNTKKTIKPTTASTTVKLTTNTKAPCGISSMISSRIIGGITSKAGQWPWQAAILRDGIFICGGTLISPEWILTAAQCIDRISASSIKVVLGKQERESSSGYEQIISTTLTIVHPKYNHPKNLNNDIALIKLSKPAQLNQHVQVVCLPHQGEKIATNRKCYLSGWGKSSRSGSYMKKLHHASLSTVANKDCQKLNSKYVSITDQMLCATDNRISMISGCYGDTGGPFVCQEVDGHWKLHGIYSWGSPKCSSSDAYTVFTRAGEFHNWINQYL